MYLLRVQVVNKLRNVGEYASVGDGNASFDGWLNMTLRKPSSLLPRSESVFADLHKLLRHQTKIDT
jgi:hypothetical protein